MLHIVPEAVEVPGRCALSQTTTGPFIDTQITLVRYGRLYVSLAYLNSIAGEVGFASAAELRDAVEARQAALDRAEEAEDRAERFDEDVQNVCDAMVAFLAAVKVNDGLLDELEAARESVSMLTERVAALEGSE